MSRVVVTGLGCVSALGGNPEEFAEALLEGRHGVGAITRFDASAFRVRVAAEVQGFEPEAHFPAPGLSRLDRFSQFAVLTARQAAADAGLRFDERTASRTCVIFGTGVGGQESQEETYRRLYGEGASRLHPFTVARLMPSAACSHVSLDLGITGPVLGTVSACSSAGHALCLAVLMLRSGMADAVLAGGAEACITPGSFRAWEAMRVMAPDRCRPFSRGRGGMVIGEGAATLLLEREEHARARGAAIHAEVAGVGMSSDAHDLVQPSAAGMSRAMQAALEDARLRPDAVDYVNAHGTGTAHNDVCETRALREVFGAHAERLAVSSTKSMTGHLLGASAALEAAATLLAMRRKAAPPTIGYLGPDPDCDLDYVPNEARELDIRVAQSNSFAFGGLNTAVLFRRYS